jgi:lipopolysaccharide transport system permease protein
MTQQELQSKAAIEELVIEPNSGVSDFWRDIVRFRELFFFLAWRDIKIRYKQTVIGVLWSIVQPLATVAVLVVVFGKVARLPSGNIPYPLMVFAAMLPWYFFSSSFSAASNSLVGNANLLTKVYFPRIILPASGMIVSLIDFLVSLFLCAGLMTWYLYVPNWQILTLPFFLILAMITSLGAGFWISTLNVRYRDFRYVIPFIIQFGLYISPVGFSSSIIPEHLRFWYSLNPMVGVIDGFRWAILGADVKFYWPGFILSICFAVIMFATGLWYFRRREKTFADVI